MKPLVKHPLLDRHNRGELVLNLHIVGGVPPLKPLCLEVGMDFSRGELL